MSRGSLELSTVVRLSIALVLAIGVVWRRIDPAAVAALTVALNALTKH